MGWENKRVFVAVAAMLAASLVLNGYFVFNDSLQKEVAGLQNQFQSLSEQNMELSAERAALESQAAAFQNRLRELQNQSSGLENVNVQLQSEKSELQSLLNQTQGVLAPKLVTRLGSTDSRYNYTGQSIHLFVEGEVWNVGNAPAYNCSLHITLYQGSTAIKETFVELGTIEAGAYKDVTKSVFYSGEALTNWTIIPHCNTGD